MSQPSRQFGNNVSIPTRRDALKLAAGLAGVAALGSIPASAQMDLEDALLFHHKLDSFNENGKIPDASENGIVGHPDDKHSTDANLEFVEDETRGTVLEFQGQDTDADDGAYNVHHEDVPDSLERGAPITTSVWAKPEDLEGWQTIFSGALGCVIDIRNGNLRARFWDGGNVFNVNIDASTYLTAGEWNHIVTSVAPGEEAQLFVNGELVGTESVDENQGYRSVYKAQGVGMAPHGMDPFGGRLDDLRFYVGASASETDAERLYESQKAGEEDEENTSASESDSSISVDVPGFSITSSLAAVSSIGYMLKHRLISDQSEK
jgi:hypothetical protein